MITLNNKIYELMKFRCTGLEIASLAAIGAGTGLSIAGQQQAKGAMESKARAEMLRQKGFQDQGKQEFVQSLGQSDQRTANDQLAEGQQQAGAEYSKVNQVPLAASSATPVATGTQTPIQSSRDQASIGIGNRAAAGLQGYNHYDLMQMIKNMRANQNLQQISGNARGSAAVLPYELQAASHAGDSMSGIGSILSMLGSLTGLYAAVQPVAVARAATIPAATPVLSPAQLTALNPAGMDFGGSLLSKLAPVSHFGSEPFHPFAFYGGM